MSNNLSESNPEREVPSFMDARFAPLRADEDLVANGVLKYRGASFHYTVHKLGMHGFQPRVVYRYGIRDLEQFMLPEDLALAETEVEACRKAELQAVGWWHACIGASEGFFRL